MDAASPVFSSNKEKLRVQGRKEAQMTGDKNLYGLSLIILDTNNPPPTHTHTWTVLVPFPLFQGHQNAFLFKNNIYNNSWEFHTMYLDINLLSSSFSQIHPYLLSNPIWVSVSVCLSLKLIKSKLCYSTILGCGAWLEHGGPTRCHTLKK